MVLSRDRTCSSIVEALSLVEGGSLGRGRGESDGAGGEL